ncbi:type II toxin-antitoxin system PrlF family antitoxin [Halomonas rhizosphaerae]|uniref:Type II toxin-antitoxin system PrlF family antitoxin n=1 Tax=Halomonas rhizosphaerae TaxID=3043296 RepID=A0ABT6V370_9GAMM|nr:type II toxin-antitoxin system PrlF family antitoxin [Halomonas rhizosphaerae]MDI5891352.1 type II toxin-antitoxin system PrlF family antitoxin [Halomonas rhizosphaerae]
MDTTEGTFLTFLEKGLINRPNRIRPVKTKTFVEAERLTADIEVDLAEALAAY